MMNEEPGVQEFHRRTTDVLSSLTKYEYELIFIDDGSTDSTFEIISKVAQEDLRIRAIKLSRNFGHQINITAGIETARGDAVVVIDADLQDPPEVIPEFVDAWQQGYGVVYGVRTHRQGESGFKLITARIFYRLLSRLSDTPLPVDSGDFRLMSRKVVNALNEIHEEHRYMRGLVAWVGYKQIGIPYERDSRHAGETKYTFRKMIRFAINGITSFSDKPLRMATQFGALVTAISLSIGMYFLINKIINPSMQIRGYASTMIAILFLGGIQLMSVGILGEYMGRTYTESKKRPLYFIDEAINLDSSQDV